MSYQTLTLETDNHVATITLNRPEMMNAFSEQLIWDMGEATKAVKDDSQIRILVITGEGRGFTAGADLSERDASWTDTKDALERGYYPFIKNIIDMPKPVIGSINGAAAGIGAAVAMACDLRIMAKEAYIMSVFSNIALVPDGGLSFLLTREIGYSRALEYRNRSQENISRRVLKSWNSQQSCGARSFKRSHHGVGSSLVQKIPTSIS